MNYVAFLGFLVLRFSTSQGPKHISGAASGVPSSIGHVQSRASRQCGSINWALQRTRFTALYALGIYRLGKFLLESIDFNSQPIKIEQITKLKRVQILKLLE